MMRTLILAVGLLACCLAAGPVSIKPVSTAAVWTGHLNDLALMPKVADLGIFGDAESFAAQWSQWRPEEAAPKIDFSKHLVLTTVCHGPNQITWLLALGENGDLSAAARMTQRGGRGFTYSMALVPWDGIKSVNGRQLSAPASRPATAPATRPAERTQASMKGWELYIWQDDQTTCYALLVGTNRLKQDAEIAAAAVRDLAAIKRQLDQLKPGESVFIAGRRRDQQVPAEAAAAVRQYARKVGLNVP